MSSNTVLSNACRLTNEDFASRTVIIIPSPTPAAPSQCQAVLSQVVIRVSRIPMCVGNGSGNINNLYKLEVNKHRITPAYIARLFTFQSLAKSIFLHVLNHYPMSNSPSRLHLQYSYGNN